MIWSAFVFCTTMRVPQDLLSCGICWEPTSTFQQWLLHNDLINSIQSEGLPHEKFSRTGLGRLWSYWFLVLFSPSKAPFGLCEASAFQKVWLVKLAFFPPPDHTGSPVGYSSIFTSKDKVHFTFQWWWHQSWHFQLGHMKVNGQSWYWKHQKFLLRWCHRKLSAQVRCPKQTHRLGN